MFFEVEVNIVNKNESIPLPDQISRSSKIKFTRYGILCLITHFGDETFLSPKTVKLHPAQELTDEIGSFFIVFNQNEPNISSQNTSKNGASWQ